MKLGFLCCLCLQATRKHHLVSYLWEGNFILHISTFPNLKLDIHISDHGQIYPNHRATSHILQLIHNPRGTGCTGIVICLYLSYRSRRQCSLEEEAQATAASVFHFHTGGAAPCSLCLYENKKSMYPILKFTNMKPKLYVNNADMHSFKANVY